MEVGDSNQTVGPQDLDFDDLMRLLEARHTRDLVDRHVRGVLKVCKICHRGFLLKHVDALTKLMNVIVSRYAGEENRKPEKEWAPAIIAIVRIASLPFVSLAASDVLSYSQSLPGFVSAVAGVFPHVAPIADADAAAEVVSTEIRMTAAQMLAAMARHGLRPALIEGTEEMPASEIIAECGTPNLKVIHQSTAMDHLSTAFRVETDEDTMIVMLGAIRDFSLFRPLSKQITNCGLLSNLIHVVRLNILGSDLLLVAVEVLWNVLELDWEGSSMALGCLDILDSFRYFVDTLMVKGYRHRDRIFRNDILVLVFLIAKHPKNHANIAKSGLLSILLKYGITDDYRKRLQESGVLKNLMSMYPEVEACQSECVISDTAQKLTTSSEDLEFRILVWKVVSLMTTEPVCGELISGFQFVASILSYLDPLDDGALRKDWSREQLKKLQLEAMSALYHLVQVVPDEFSGASGSAICMRLLETTTDAQLRKQCLILMQKTVMCGPTFVDEFGKNGINILLEQFKWTDLPLATRQIIASVLSDLCNGHEEHQNHFRKLGGIEALKNEVVYRPDETTENHLYYTVAIVDLVWSSIVGCKKNVMKFVESEGLFALLDILEIAPQMLKGQILGVVADLMEYNKVPKMFYQWTSQKTMRGSIHVLIDFWIEEQTARNALAADGVISNLERPLNPDPTMGGQIDQEANDMAETLYSSTGFGHTSIRSSSDKMAELRDALSDPSQGRSAVLSKSSHLMSASAGGGDLDEAEANGEGHEFGEPSLEQTEAVATGSDRSPPKITRGQAQERLEILVSERHDVPAKIYAVLCRAGFDNTETLTPEQQQQMELIKLYPECRQLETWMDVMQSLDETGLRPISMDQKWIEDSIAEHKTRTLWIQSLQQQLSDDKVNESLISLDHFYEDLLAQAGRSGSQAPPGQDSAN